jgi:hypothetical protein
MPYADKLFPYWDYPGKWPAIQWTPAHVKKKELLTEAYLPFVKLGRRAPRGNVLSGPEFPPIFTPTKPWLSVALSRRQWHPNTGIRGVL